MTATVTALPPVALDVEAGVIEEARARQRRHWTVAAAATVAALVAAGLVALIGPSGVGPGARSDGSPPSGHPIHAGPLTVTLPTGWHWLIKQGGLRGCTNPVIRLEIASYRLPAWFADPNDERIVVPANAVLLIITSAPIKSSATPWRSWHLSNPALTPWHPINQFDPDRYRAKADLPGSAAITAVALLGSIPMPAKVLAVANGVLSSIQVDRSYACR